MTNRGIHLVLGALLAVLVTSCGGGSTTADGGIGGTGISRGAVTQFGSIHVNGRRFDIDSARVTVNGVQGTQSDLDLGYVVRVRGDLEDGRAESVRFDADLMGPVDDASGVDSDSTLVVMQQTVKVTASTRLVGATVPGDVDDGDPVLISGYRDSDDVLVAKHLEVLATPPSEDQVLGRVTGTGVNQFAIGSLTVISEAQPGLGDRVLVRGAYNASGPELMASTVEDVEDLFEAGAPVELEGIVDDFNDMSDFTVDGIPVDATGVTPEGGTVGVNVAVEVEGRFDASGTLVADSVEIEDDTRIRGRVATVNESERTVTFFDTADGPLVVARVTDNTRLRVNLGDLQSGDWVELEGSEDGSGEVTALRLESDDPEDRVRLRGMVDGVDAGANEIVILGVVFDTSGADIEDDSEQPIALGDIEAGDIARVRWQDNDDGTATVERPQPVEDVELQEDRTP